MADSEDPGTTGRPSSQNAQSRATVSWRGIVDEPMPGEEKPKRRWRILESLGHAFDAVLVALGFRRPRNPDGTLGPRHLGRGFAIVGGLVVVLLLVSALHIIPAGTVGVPVTFGNAGSPLGDGLQITAPWPIASVSGMSVQTQNYTMTAAKVPGTDDAVLVLGRDGASAAVDATVLYRLDPSRASDVYRDVGTNYTDKLVKPSARSCIRAEFAAYDLVSAATDALPQVNERVNACMREKIEPVGIVLQDFQLREIKLGDDVQAAVNAKVSAQQTAERQKFELATAEQQANIARVNAGATSDAQQILACGGTTQTVQQDGQPVQVVVPNPTSACNPPPLTQEILTYNYIQALRDLMKSPNSNTIIVGGSSGAAPLINIPSTGSGSGSGSGQ